MAGGLASDTYAFAFGDVGDFDGYMFARDGLIVDGNGAGWRRV